MTAKEKAVQIYNFIKQTADGAANHQSNIENIKRRTDLDPKIKEREVIIAESRRDDYRKAANEQLAALVADFVNSERTAAATQLASLRTNPTFTTAAHQLTVNNALLTMSLLGDKMTAPTMQRIVDPLIRSGDLFALESIKETAAVISPQLFATGAKPVDFGPGLKSETLACAETIARCVNQEIAEGDRGSAGALLMVLGDRINHTFGEGTVSAND